MTKNIIGEVVFKNNNEKGIVESVDGNYINIRFENSSNVTLFSFDSIIEYDAIRFANEGLQNELEKARDDRRRREQEQQEREEYENNVDKLEYRNYGTNALEIYDQCVERFGFDSALRIKFGMYQPLYADNVTKEGYGCWFLAHSNLTGSKEGIRENIVSDDYKNIEQKWFEVVHDAPTLGEKRLVFAKINNSYDFIGVYECVETNPKKDVFKKIYDYYYVNIESYY